MQMKTTTRSHLTQLEWLLSTGQEIASVGEVVKRKKKEPSFSTDGNINWYGHYGKQYGGSSKVKNRVIT